MTKLKDIYRLNCPVVRDRATKDLVLDNVHVGIEVEVERASHIEHISGWKITTDGSLRGPGGREFISARPYNGSDIKKTLVKLEGALKDANASTPLDGSVHVHVDCTRLTIQQLMNVIYTSYIFEPLLLHNKCGIREDNPFCLQVEASSNMLAHVATWLSALKRAEANPKTVPSPGNRQLVKYSATNIKTLTKLGTIEYRGFPSTYDAAEIMEWINLLFKMYQFGKDLDISPMLYLKHIGAEEAITTILGEELLDHAGVYQVLYKTGIRNARALEYLINKNDRKKRHNITPHQHPPAMERVLTARDLVDRTMDFAERERDIFRDEPEEPEGEFDDEE